RENDDRLLLVNFGDRQVLHPVSEPLLSPPLGYCWDLLWTSESPRYGGAASASVGTQARWILPAESTTGMRPPQREEEEAAPSIKDLFTVWIPFLHCCEHVLFSTRS